MKVVINCRWLLVTALLVVAHAQELRGGEIDAAGIRVHEDGAPSSSSAHRELLFWNPVLTVAATPTNIPGTIEVKASYKAPTLFSIFGSNFSFSFFSNGVTSVRVFVDGQQAGEARNFLAWPTGTKEFTVDTSSFTASASDKSCDVSAEASVALLFFIPIRVVKADTVNLANCYA